MLTVDLPRRVRGSRLRNTLGAVVATAGLLLSLGSARAQISLVNVTSCGPQSFPSSCTIPATGGGHLLAVAWNSAGGTGTSSLISSITDNAGNSYSEAGAARSTDSTDNAVLDIWYAKNSLGGATSITIAVSPSGIQGSAVIWEFSGVDTISPLDQTAVLNNQSATSAPAGATVATSAPSEVVVSAVGSQNAITGIYSGNAFTNDSTVMGGGWAHLLPSTAGTYRAQWLQSLSGTYSSSTAAFKAAGSITACDLNADQTVNIFDVQAATNMNLGLAQCTAPSGFCTAAFVQAEIANALGQGCSLPVVATNPSSLSFGNILVGSGASQPVTISISGTGSTTISQATVTGAGFSLSGLTLPLSLPAGQSANFTVTFTPATAGTISGSLSLVSDGLDSPVNIALSGSGVTSLPHSISLSWTASTSANVAGYNIYRGATSGGAYTKLNSSLISGVTYTDTAVTAGQTYYYVATAVDSSNNESSYSNEASATVPSP